MATNEVRPPIPDGFTLDETPPIPDGFELDNTPSILDGFVLDRPVLSAKEIDASWNIARTQDIPLDSAKQSIKTSSAITTKQDTVTKKVVNNPMLPMGGGAYAYFPSSKNWSPVSAVKEIPKGVARFVEDKVGGTFGGTVYDWLGQFIELGGGAIDQFTKLGSKNKDQIYNPYAEAIMATGQRLSKYGKDSRKYWAYQASTGWESLDADLKTRDPIAYTTGQLSEGVASSALSVLAMYLSGGSSAVPSLINTGVQINRGLAVLSGMSAASSFEHAQNNGENFLWSTIHGFTDGLIEYSMESSFLDNIKESTPLVAGLKEGAEEVFTGALQNTRASLLENNNKGMGVYDSAKQAIISSIKQMPMDFAGGFIGGYGIKGIGDLVQLTTKANAMPLPEVAKTTDVGVKPTKLQDVTIGSKTPLDAAQGNVGGKEVIKTQTAVIDQASMGLIKNSLAEAKKVQPLTKAQQKDELKKRVGAAAGSMKSNIQNGSPVDEAIRRSTGLLKGPLTEYNQLYESIADKLPQEVKDAAYGMISNHPDLQYFGVVNTANAFDKLINGNSMTNRDIQDVEKVFGKTFSDITPARVEVSSLYDRFVATIKAGLLTGIKTSGLNTLANFSHAVSETAKDIPASLVDRAQSLYTGKRAMAFTTKGYASGVIEGIKRGWNYLKTGYDERNIGQKLDWKEVYYGDSVAARAMQTYEETIFHILGAEDQPFYYGAKARSISSQALAQGMNKGLKGKELNDFVNQLVKAPTDEMLEYAVHDAEVAVFQNRTKLGDAAKAFQQIPGGELIVLFARTPSAVAMQIVNYTPVGPVKEIVDQIHKGEFNQAKVSHAFGRGALGTGAMYIGGQLLKYGLMTLDRPETERERELWTAEGRQANSIKIGGEWRSVQTLGPVGNVLLIGGHFQYRLSTEGSPTAAIVKAMAGSVKSFSEQTFVKGMNMAIDAMTSPDKSFDNWFSSMAGSVVPTIVADIARANDEVERTSYGPLARIQSRVPFWRNKLQPKIDIMGQDTPRYGGNVLEVMIDPSRPMIIRQDVVVQELRRLTDEGLKVSPTKVGDKKGYDILTPDENTQLWRRAGDLTYKYLFELVNNEQYQSLDNDYARGEAIKKITNSVQSVARAEMAQVKLKEGKTVLELAEAGLINIDNLGAIQFFNKQ